jgi:hypothetical protein
MANSRPSDWSDQHPGGKFSLFQDTGRRHAGQEPPYYLNGYEHEGYEEQLPGTRESDELAHDDGYLPGWRTEPAYPDAEPDYPYAERAYPDAEPDYAGPGYLPPADPWDAHEPLADPWDTPSTPADPWDTSDSGYAFPVTWRWEDRGPQAPRGPRTRRGHGDGRTGTRSPRTLWMAAIGAVGLVATVLVFRWVGEAPPTSAPAAQTHVAAAPAGGMPAADTATTPYRLIAARQADGFGYNAAASHRMATATATAGGATGLARCLEAKGLNTGGTVTAVRYAQYNDGKDVTGLSLIGFGGTFGPDAARHLWQAAGSCGALAPAAVATTAAPGPHGGALYTGTANPDGTTCVWATGTTAALVWFFNGMTGLTVPDPAAACQAVRSAVEARLLCRTYASCARA